MDVAYRLFSVATESGQEKSDFFQELLNPSLAVLPHSCKVNPVFIIDLHRPLGAVYHFDSPCAYIALICLVLLVYQEYHSAYEFVNILNGLWGSILFFVTFGSKNIYTFNKFLCPVLILMCILLRIWYS